MHMSETLPSLVETASVLFLILNEVVWRPGGILPPFWHWNSTMASLSISYLTSALLSSPISSQQTPRFRVEQKSDALIASNRGSAVTTDILRKIALRRN